MKYELAPICLSECLEGLLDTSQGFTGQKIEAAARMLAEMPAREQAIHDSYSGYADANETLRTRVAELEAALIKVRRLASRGGNPHADCADIEELVERTLEAHK